jgi:hypothetical protein
MEHLRIAGQHILAAAKMNPAVAEGAGDLVSQLTQLTQAAMQQGEGMGEPGMPPQPPMPERPM